MQLNSLSQSDFAFKLKNALINNLPGTSAHKMMDPKRNFSIDEKIVKRAAVLIVFYQQDNVWTFPLIRRAEDEYPHSGQIALPGGRIEPNESASAAACREVEEEVGLKADKIRVLGKLSSITIPVSGFLVYPFISIIDFKPVWIPNPAEVDKVFPVSLADLHDETNAKIEKRIFNNKSVNIKYFHLQNQKVWGATAMILNELRLVTKILQ